MRSVILYLPPLGFFFGFKSFAAEADLAFGLALLAEVFFIGES
jgi:hypothetical protein